MNPLDDQIDRLFRAAQVPPAKATLPYGLETRVVAAWRMAKVQPGWDDGTLVRGLVLASLIMGASLWTALEQKSSPETDYLQLADSTVQTDYP